MDKFFINLADLAVLLAPPPPPSALRVRQVLDGVGAAGIRALKKHLPTDLPAMPTADTARYPNALLQFLPKPENYSYLGLISEDMLRLTVPEITLANLLALLPRYHPSATAAEINKVRTSKTTQPFLDLLVATRTQMDAVLGGAELRGESVLKYDKVMGHPDARTDTIIFEMKLTGQLMKNWSYFTLQALAYAALDPAIMTVCLVLPLQSTVWRCDVSGWANRLKYRDALNAAATKLLAPAAPKPPAPAAVGGAGAAVGGAGAAAPAAAPSVYNPALALALTETYKIGHHAPKFPTLMKTVAEFPDPSKPYQIFLGGPQSSKMKVTDGELAATSSLIAAAHLKVYVHSQYIINLANATAADDWNVTLLARNLQYAAAIGCRGVVVHVGKATDKPYATALENMRVNIARVLEHAKPECPLLLETPAGQGTETLKGDDEFIAFVESFGGDPRLRVCLDTCHVFACGHKPLTFIDKLAAKPDLLQLIHYNDSLEPCGSCKDRHAPIGGGHIGYGGMEAIAKRCHELGLPMVIE